MPWQEETPMSQRQELIMLAKTEAVTFSQLCRRFGISRTTGYKWLNRVQNNPQEDFADRSRRPKTTPTKTPVEIECQVINLRKQHPAWGGRKISRILKNEGRKNVPAPSTITHILHRFGLITSSQTGEGAAYHRFEHAQPNQLWQMDFKGSFATGQGRCEPLTVLDDHSRYNLVLHAMQKTSTAPVKQVLTETFRHYGLPIRINTDNGPPWGSPSAKQHGISQLTVWLIRLGVQISFSRPAHPQTNGKEERFHRTLKAEVLAGQTFTGMAHVQQAFDNWRTIYNHIRPHDALDLAVPASRYQPSTRSFPECLPDIEYSPDDEVSLVTWNGEVRFKQHRLKVSNALQGLPIAFRARHEQDGIYDMYFCHHKFGKLDFNQMGG